MVLIPGQNRLDERTCHRDGDLSQPVGDPNESKEHISKASVSIFLLCKCSLDTATLTFILRPAWDSSPEDVEGIMNRVS